MNFKTCGGLATVIFLAFTSTLAVAGMDGTKMPTAPVRLVGVAPVETEAGTTLEVRLSGPFTFTSYQPNDRSLIVDLAGVVSDPVTPGPVTDIAWLDNYRLLPFRNAGGHHVLRVNLTLNQDCEVAVSRATESTLSLACEPAAGPASPAEPDDTVPAVSAAPKKPLPLSPPRKREPAGDVLVRRIRVEGEAEDFAVVIEASGALGYKTLELNKPRRLVLDLPGSILAGRARQIEVDSPLVSRVRVAQFKANPPVTRVVLDLKGKVPHRVEEIASGLRVVLTEDVKPKPLPAAPSHKPVRPIVARETPASQPGESTESAESVPKSSPKQGISAPKQDILAEKTPVVPVFVSMVAAKNEEPEPTATAAEPVQIASLAPMVPASVGLAPTLPVALPVPAAENPAPDAEPVKAEPVAEPAAETVAVQAPSMPTQAPAQGAPGGAQSQGFEVPAAAAPDTREFTGDPVSLNLQEVDLKDFFRLIHELSGLNIVVDPNVAGAVTLVLVDVPWDQALDIVLKNNGLDHSLEGNVLRIATRDTLKAEADSQRDLAKARAESVAPVTVARELHYARAADIEQTLQRFLSSRGQLMQDERTNTIIIRDIPSVIPAIDDMIKQLDRKTHQVEIEARVVSARRNFSRDIGAQLGLGAATRQRNHFWGGVLPNNPIGRIPAGNDDANVPDASLPANVLPPLIANTSQSGSVPLASDLGAVGATSALSYSFSSPNFALDIILSAAESRGIARVLSRPRIITQNNILGFVKQGARIPVQTEINNTISTQFIDAVLELRVTPMITGDGNIFLNIAIKNDRPDFALQVNGVPTIVTQEVTTQVLVSDGGTVVVGGVMVQDNSTTVNQVPILGSIPIIGYLFKRTFVQTINEELMFFITPRIMN